MLYCGPCGGIGPCYIKNPTTMSVVVGDCDFSVVVEWGWWWLQGMIVLVVVE